MELRVGVISDIHYGSDSEFQIGSKAPELLSSFVTEMHEFRPHLVVDLGDRINNLDRRSDLLNLRALARTMSSLPCSLRYVLGNHDLVHVSVRETERLLGQQLAGLRAECLQGFPLLFINSEAEQPRAPDYDLLFRELELDHAESKVIRTIITFSHRPLLQVPLTQHRLFDPESTQHCPWGMELLVELIDRGFRVICFNGHLHWNHLLIDGQIKQVTLPSLVDMWQVGVPAGSFGTVIVRRGGIHCEVRGKLPVHYDLNMEMG